MTRVQDFVADFARAGKDFTEINKKNAYLLIMAQAEFSY
jgi:hypothetical protein